MGTRSRGRGEPPLQVHVKSLCRDGQCRELSMAHKRLMLLRTAGHFGWEPRKHLQVNHGLIHVLLDLLVKFDESWPCVGIFANAPGALRAKSHHYHK